MNWTRWGWLLGSVTFAAAVAAAPTRHWEGANIYDGLGDAVACGRWAKDSGADVAIGASLAGTGEAGRVGIVYLYAGKTGAPIRTFSGGASGDELGRCLRFADVNGDGYGDLVAGAPGASPGGRLGAGSVFVFSGKTGVTLWRVDGEEAGDRFGTSVAAGDVNHDGKADVIAGAPQPTPDVSDHAGKVAVLSGPRGRLLFSLKGQPGENFGTSVAAGDVNGDGWADLVVGAPGGAISDPGGSQWPGRAYVISGRTRKVMFRQHGEVSADNYGYVVACADVNGDRKADAIVAAPNSDAPGVSLAGNVYVFAGPKGHLLRKFSGTTRLGLLGRALACADVNGDGVADVIASAPTPGWEEITDTGAVYAFSGKTGKVLRVVRGTDARELFGQSVAGADTDGDKRADLLVGAPGTAPGGQPAAGAAYLFTRP